VDLRGRSPNGGRSGFSLFNLAVLAAAIPAALSLWAAVGELIGDVLQSDGGGPFVQVVTLVLSLLYVSLVLYFVFLPGFAVFLLLARQIGRRTRLVGVRERAVLLALSPVIALVFYVIPAVPEDRAGVIPAGGSSLEPA
jgi:hypothetical protein